MLGNKLRKIRNEKGLTLNDLSKKTQLTASYLSQLERNIVEPSLSSLRKISDALDVPIFSFLTSENKYSVLIKANNRKKLEMPNTNVKYEFISPMANDFENVKMATIYITIDPKSWDGDFLVHSSDECIFLIKGQLEVYLLEKKYTLFEGDSIYIKADIPHKVYNPGNETAVGITNLCPPIITGWNLK